VLSALKERFPKAKLHAMVGAMTVVAMIAIQYFCEVGVQMSNDCRIIRQDARLKVAG
jgi:hypothetical protein